MPRYDYRCANGHVEEVVADRDASSVPCPLCSAVATRIVTVPPSVNGFSQPPMRERKLPVSWFIEAQHQMVDEAQRTGVMPPDPMEIAKRQAALVEKHAPELVTGT